jgi:SAM-dependent methyltransferase
VSAAPDVFPCRLCGHGALRLADRGDVALYRCGACDFVSGRPAREIEARERYAGYYHAAVLGAPPPLARYDEWLARAAREVGVGRLLEVGAGAGGFARQALRRGWQVDATEMAGSALEPLRATGARVFAGDLLEARYPAASFDCAVLLEVLEHLPEPACQLAELARVLRPGGVLLLSTPSFAGLSRRALGLRWRVIDPEHLGYFSVSTLRAALRAAGFARCDVVSRALDVWAWRRPAGDAPAGFDPQAAAAARERVDASGVLRAAKESVHKLLGWSGLGDSLLAWAWR